MSARPVGLHPGQGRVSSEESGGARNAPSRPCPADALTAVAAGAPRCSCEGRGPSTAETRRGPERECGPALRGAESSARRGESELPRRAAAPAGVPSSPAGLCGRDRPRTCSCGQETGLGGTSRALSCRGPHCRLGPRPSGRAPAGEVSSGPGDAQPGLPGPQGRKQARTSTAKFRKFHKSATTHQCRLVA